MKDITMKDEYLSEDIKMKWLKIYSDKVVKHIMNNDFIEAEAILFLENVKKKILNKFPEKEKQYELIYGRRFKRIFSKKGIFVELYQDKIPRN